MFCRRCGNELPDTAKFCAKCGEKVKLSEPVFERRTQRVGMKKSGNEKRVLTQLLVYINAVAWIVVLWNISFCTFQKAEDFMDWIHMYMNSVNQYTAIYYGIWLWFSFVSVWCAITGFVKNKCIHIFSAILAVTVPILIAVMKIMCADLEGHYLNSVSDMMIYLVTGIYSKNIWKKTYASIVVSLVFWGIRIFAAKSTNRNIGERV